jgi:histidyl-tRNA synthetase
MRILDSKVPETQALLSDAPLLSDYLDDASKAHFDGLCARLDAAGLSYTLNPKLVRGLDYYGLTVFEWTTTALGAQGTVCAGGRYDGLVQQLGGKATPAMGLERLCLLLETLEALPESKPLADVYIIANGEACEIRALSLAESLRDALPAVKVVLNCGGGSFKSQFKKADKSGAAVAVVLGEDELANEQVTVKVLRGEPNQQQLAISDLAEHIKTTLL